MESNTASTLAQVLVQAGLRVATAAPGARATVLRAFEPWVRRIDDPWDEPRVEEILSEAATSDEMRVLVVDIRR